MRDFERLNSSIIACERCPRLVSYIREVASTKRRAFLDWEYWGKPVANFGDPDGRIIIAGLAPAAHGGNRTGRMFTGDESGNFLFRALYETGLANQPESSGSDDGLALSDTFITAAVHCAPPSNKPSKEEYQNCRAWLIRSFECASQWRVAVTLGRIAFEQTLAALQQAGQDVPVRRSAFAHGAEFKLPGGRWILCSYHPSQQNTYTRKLTPPMLLAVFQRAVALLGGE